MRKKIYNLFNNHIFPFVQNVFFNSIGRFYISIFGSVDNRKLKYKYSLCLIFKDEAPFLKEWIEYHLTIGINHFYLYNNNSNDNYNEILDPFIKQGFVTLIDWPYMQAQARCYKHCLDLFKNETNWIGYIDADEFICPKYAQSFDEWIKPFEKYPAIVIDWLQFGSSGLINHDFSRNVIEQYTACWDYFWMGKTFVNTRYEVTNWNTTYFHHLSYMRFRIFGVSMAMPAVNQFGFVSPIGHRWGYPKQQIEKASIHLNHYYIKAWNVYKEKMKKPDVFFTKNAKDYEKLLTREMKCINNNTTILRFLQKMRLNVGVIE